MHKCDVARSEKRQNQWRGKTFGFDEVHGRRQKTTERVGIPFGRTGFREIHPPLPTTSVTITYALVAITTQMGILGHIGIDRPEISVARAFPRSASSFWSDSDIANVHSKAMLHAMHNSTSRGGTSNQ